MPHGGRAPETSTRIGARTVAGDATKRADLDARASDRSGVGLGLTIAAQAAERSGACVRGRNLPGTGCVFSVILPPVRR